MITWLILSTIIAACVFALGIVSGIMLEAMERDFQEERRRDQER